VRWQRAARIGLAVAGVSFAIALYTMTRERPPEEAPLQPPPPEDRTAKEIGGPGVAKIVDRSGKDVGELRFERSLSFPDGRSRYEKARFADARGFAVSADVATALSGAVGDKPQEMTFEGNVVFRDDADLQVQTDRATYTDATGVLQMPGAVTFTRGRLSGQGTGAVYYRDTDTMQFLADAVARVAPDEHGQGRAEATAKTMTLLRSQKMLRLEQDARIRSDAETLSGDTASIYFTDDESAMKFLELRGRASVLPIDPAPAGAGRSSVPAMRASDITLGFHPDGRTVQHATLTTAASLDLTSAAGARSVRANWIDLFLAADGRTLTNLDARDNVVVVLPASDKAPAREIRSATLIASGRGGKGLEVAQFQQNVRFTETPAAAGAPPRTATARTLNLSLGGELDAIDRAEFQREAVFTDGDVRGEADQLIYDAVKNQLALRPLQGAPRRLARVTDDKFTVDAPEIDVALETDDLSARGGVTTNSKQGASKRPSGLFSSDESVQGRSVGFAYVSATGTATYTGKAGEPARVVQGKSEIEAPEIRIADETGNLDAAGGVKTVFLMEADDAGGKPVEYTTTAQTFRYDDAKRTAVYRAVVNGPVAEMTGSDGSVVAGESIALTLAEESRAVTHLRVDGSVGGTLTGNYEFKGATLTYTAATGLYVLTGTPARVKSPSSDKKDCLLTHGKVLEFTRTTNTPRQREADAYNSSKRIPCAEPIR
jgi:lipopolysaccharide export system protein LptA